MRWRDASQSADIIHFFGLAGTHYAKFAHQKGIKLVSSVLLGGLGARPALKRELQKMAIRTIQRVLPPGASSRMGWDGWKVADAYVALTEWEKHLMNDVFQVPLAKISVVPNGVEAFFLDAAPSTRGKWLVTTGSILPVKRIVETAEAAILAKVPYRVIGKPFSEGDPYHRRFTELTRANPGIILYEGPVTDRQQLAQIYRDSTRLCVALS